MHVFDKTCHEAYALEKTQEVTSSYVRGYWKITYTFLYITSSQNLLDLVQKLFNNGRST